MSIKQRMDLNKDNEMDMDNIDENINAEYEKGDFELIQLMKNGTNDEYLPQLYKYSNPQEKTIYVDALNEYYKLKSVYDEQIRIKKLTGNKSDIKIKCVNCGQVGGTIFNRTHVSGKSVQLTAKCGNEQTPCPLDILINLGIIVNVQNELSALKKDIEDIKTQIIKEKNNLIYGYVSNDSAVDNFNQYKEYLSSATYMYEEFMSIYLNQTDNFEKQKKIEKLKVGLYDTINAIKSYIKDYNKTENTQFVKDAVELYIDSLYVDISKTKPFDKMNLMEKLEHLEYPVHFVEKQDNKNDNDKKKIYELFERHYTKDSLELNTGEDFGVSKMITGTGNRIKKKKNNKTIKRLDSSNKKTKNKTSKVKIVFEADTDTQSEEKEKEERLETLMDTNTIIKTPEDVTRIIKSGSAPTSSSTSATSATPSSSTASATEPSESIIPGIPSPESIQQALDSITLPGQEPPAPAPEPAQTPTPVAEQPSQAQEQVIQVNTEPLTVQTQTQQQI